MEELVRMTGGEFRTVREYLGLSGDAMAALLGVAPRTIPKWEGGEKPIPYRVRDEVERIERFTANAVDQLVRALGDARDPAVVVYRHDRELAEIRPELAAYTARWWRHVVARAVHEVPGVEIFFPDEVPDDAVHHNTTATAPAKTADRS